MKILQQRKRVKHECHMERVKKVKYEESMKSERNSDALKECNSKKVQNEKSLA